MIPTGLVWAGAVILFPVLAFAYFHLVIECARRAFGYHHRRANDGWLYLSLLGLLSAAAVIRAPVSIRLDLSAMLPVAVAVGVAMYAVDTAVWSFVSGADAGRSAGVARAEVGLAVLAPAAEELLYRGVLELVRPSVGVLGYVVLSAVAFGLNHHYLGKKEIAFKSVDGLVYAALYVATGNLLVPIAAHLSYNLAYLGYAVDVTGLPRVHGNG